MLYEKNLKDDLTNACKSINRMTVFDACEKLKAVLDYELNFELIEKEGISWQNLYIICMGAQEKRRWPNPEGENLVNTLRLRKHREIKYLNGLSKEERELFYAIENKTITNVCKFIEDNYKIHGQIHVKKIRRLVINKEKSLDNPLDSDAIQTCIPSWDDLISIIREMPLEGKSSKDVLLSVLQLKKAFVKSKRKPSKQAFIQCSLCWRLVPKRFLGKKENIYCHYHTYDEAIKLGKAYERALKIQADKILPQSFVPIRQSLYGLCPISDDQRYEFEQWLQVWEEDPLQAQKTMPWEMPWSNKETLAPIIPNIINATYMVREDISQNTSVIVNILTPIHPNSNCEEQKQAQALHNMWKRNFRLFIPELVHAEAWLLQSLKSHPISNKESIFPA